MTKDVQDGTRPLAVEMPDPTVQVRRVRRDDVRLLHAGCYTGYDLWRVEAIVERAIWLEYQGRGFGLVMPAESADAIHAYGQLTLWPRTAEISDLMVTPGYRGQGMGTVMIQYLVSAAQARGTHDVEIGVAQSNPRALSLYERLGFEQAYTTSVITELGEETVHYLTLRLPDT